MRIRAGLGLLRRGRAELPLAVRSSALSEDSAQASFAGAFESVLDVRGDDAVRAALEQVRRSRHAGRVAAYSEAQGIDAAHELAVVVQRLVPAEHSGVLFSADPVTGSRSAVVGNAVSGLGERLVSGEATGEAFTLQRPKGTYAGPAALRPHAKALYRLALALEQTLGGPQDIEWAIAGGKLALLQARPITTLRGHDPATGAWNDSLTGEYLWTATNLGEAVPDVMTPCTWSLMQDFIEDTLSALYVTDVPPLGNIGGRCYMNLSAVASMALTFGMSEARFRLISEETFGKLPEGLTVPWVPLKRWEVLKRLVPWGFRFRLRLKRNHRRLPEFVAAGPARCDALHARIAAAATPAALASLWRDDLQPYFSDCAFMLEAGARGGAGTPVELRSQLQKQVGDADANALLSGLSGSGNPLASLGPLLGLEQLARGELDRDTYARRYGHRSPHEFEISIARPAEEPGWIDRQLEGLRDAPLQVTALLARQHEAHTAAWARYQAKYPRRARRMRRKLDLAGDAARAREAVRSELIRTYWALRAFVLRAGVLTGHGDALFFLTIDEVIALLGGDASALAFVPARRATHAKWTALPVYPALIRGRFDPVRWAADPQRRADLFDARGNARPAGDAVTGFPGAAGVVEGLVRVLLRADDGAQLQPGEILVTTVTNVGWTPLFPRAGAVVTDVGAPLSHAAIVARELGIPAVVGCGNATMRLRTGDRVRVNGSQGTVELLPPAPAPASR